MIEASEQVKTAYDVVISCPALRGGVFTYLFITGTKHLGETIYRRKNLSRLIGSVGVGHSSPDWLAS